MSEAKWSDVTMQMINRITTQIEGKSFDPDWFNLRQRFEEIDQLKSTLLATQQSLRESEVKLEHILEVLKWCDVNRVIVQTYGELQTCRIECFEHKIGITKPTLFEALESAWKGRQERTERCKLCGETKHAATPQDTKER